MGDKEGGSDGGPRAGRTGIWFFLYVLASSTMPVVNKSAVVNFPFPDGVLFLQLGSSVLFLFLGRALGLVSFDATIRAEKVKAFWGVMVAWAVPMIVSMQCFKYLTVETVVVFRTLTTFAVAGGDMIIFKKTFSSLSLLSILFIVIGSIIFALNDWSFSLIGYFWAILYALATCVNALYIKHVFNEVAKLDMSNTEKMYYNNLMGMPVMLILMLATEDTPAFVTLCGEVFSGQAEAAGVKSAILFASCAMGTLISAAGTNLRDLISATSFNVSGNVNKFITVFLSAILFRTNYTANAMSGLVIALIAGVVYGWSMQKKP